MKKRVSISVLYMICISIICSICVNFTSKRANDNEAIASTIMGYSYGNVNFMPIMVSDATIRFKYIALLNWWLTRHYGDMELNISQIYEDNKGNSEIVLNTTRKGTYDNRLFIKHGNYMIKLKDLNGDIDYVLYEDKLVKIDTSNLPPVLSRTRDSLAYLYKLVEVTNGVDEATGLDYVEYHYNKVQGLYGVGIRLLFKDDRLYDYRIL